LYHARSAVEGEAVRLLAQNATDEQLQELEDAYADLLSATESHDARAIGDADINFHQLLVNLAGSRRLSDYMSSLAIETRIAIFSLPDGFAVPAEVSSTYSDLVQ